MKKNKLVLLSSILFLSYDIYIVCSYLWYHFHKDEYGYVYQDILIVPHFIFLSLGTVFNFLYFFNLIFL